MYAWIRIESNAIADGVAFWNFLNCQFVCCGVVPNVIFGGSTGC
jgi:hypothetical protein